MKNKKINHALYYEESKQKNKNNISLIKINKSSNYRYNHSSLIISSSKTKNFGKFAFNEKISKPKFRYTKIIKYDKKLKDTENINNNQKIYKVDVKQFYRIRKNIYYNLKKPYISPYMNYFLFNENNINLSIKTNKNESSLKDQLKYYNYFQISYLMNKRIKNFRLLSRYNDYLIFDDDQEYLMKYFTRKEIKNIMKYLLFHIYDKDKLFISYRKKKEYLDESDVINLLSENENNTKEGKISEHTNNINDGIKSLSSNSIIKTNNIKKLKPILKPNINYLYINDIPKELIPNCSPNLFPHTLKQNFNLKMYIIFRKKNKNVKLEKLIKKNKKDFGVNQNDYINLIYEKFEKETITQENKYNILDDISFSSKDKKEDMELNIPKNKIWKNDFKNKKEDFKEIEYFLHRFNSLLIHSKDNQDKLKYQQIQKINSVNKKQESYKINDNNDNSINENKNKITMNNKNHFKKITKKAFFKTSLNGTYSHSLFDKNISEKSTFYNPNSSIKIPSDKKNPYNLKYGFTRNKQCKDKMKKIINNVHSQQKTKNSHINAKTISGKLRHQSFYNSYHKISSNSNKNKNFQNKLINFDTKSFKPSISQTKYQKNHTYNIKRNCEISIRDINKSHIYGLYEFGKMYDEIKSKGLLPKTKISYSLIHSKPFEGTTGFNFLDKINKDNTRDIEGIEEKTKTDYLFNNIKKNIKRILKRNILFSKDNFSLKTLIKCPSLYSINKQ